MTLVSSKRGSDDTHGDYTYYIYKNASRGSSSNFRIYDTDPTKGGFSRQDSLNIYNNQEELNKLAESINSRVQARNENANDDWDLFMQNKNEIGDLYSEYDKKRFENYKEYYEQGQDLKDNPFFLEGYTGEGALVWYGEENFKGEYVPSEKEGEYVGNTPELNKYKPVKPSELKVKKKEIKKKKEKLLKIDPIPLQPLPTDDSLPEPVKAPPYKLIKNKSNYYTTERVGIGTHTYPKGDDNKPLVRLKDEAGRTIFTGSQTEYTEKYGNYLKRGTTEYGKRKKSRLYLKNKKQTGGVKETPAQYNARIKTEYEANMQSYSDSTASYKNRIEIDRIMTGIEKRLDKHAAKNRIIKGSTSDLIKDSTSQKAADKVTDRYGGTQIDTTKWEEEDQLEYDELIDHNSKKWKEAFVLHRENRKRGIYGYYKPGKPGIPFIGDRKAEDLKPTLPRKPITKIPSIGMKTINMGETTIPELEPSKRKYMTSSDGKWKINLETGEKTRVKTQKVKKGKGPGRRRGPTNLVTGRRGKKLELGYKTGGYKAKHIL